MAESVFGDKATRPTEGALYAALGQSGPWWDALLAECGGVGEWKHYTKAAGWVYPVKLGKRTLFYMLPKEGRFKLTFVFGERAVQAAKTAGLPPPVLDELLAATAYVEGRGVALEVTQAADLDIARTLLKIKLEN